MKFYLLLFTDVLYKFLLEELIFHYLLILCISYSCIIRSQALHLYSSIPMISAFAISRTARRELRNCSTRSCSVSPRGPCNGLLLIVFPFQLNYPEAERLQSVPFFCFIVVIHETVLWWVVSGDQSSIDIE